MSYLSDTARHEFKIEFEQKSHKILVLNFENQRPIPFHLGIGTIQGGKITPSAWESINAYMNTLPNSNKEKLYLEYLKVANIAAGTVTMKDDVTQLGPEGETIATQTTDTCDKLEKSCKNIYRYLGLVRFGKWFDEYSATIPIPDRMTETCSDNYSASETYVVSDYIGLMKLIILTKAVVPVWIAGSVTLSETLKKSLYITRMERMYAFTSGMSKHHSYDKLTSYVRCKISKSANAQSSQAGNTACAFDMGIYGKDAIPYITGLFLIQHAWKYATGAPSDVSNSKSKDSSHIMGDLCKLVDTVQKEITANAISVSIPIKDNGDHSSTLEAHTASDPTSAMRVVSSTEYVRNTKNIFNWFDIPENELIIEVDPDISIHNYHKSLLGLVFAEVVMTNTFTVVSSATFIQYMRLGATICRWLDLPGLSRILSISDSGPSKKERRRFNQIEPERWENTIRWYHEVGPEIPERWIGGLAEEMGTMAYPREISNDLDNFKREMCTLIDYKMTKIDKTNLT